MRQEWKGTGKVFSFTVSRYLKKKSFVIGTLAFMLLCFLLPAGIMAAVESFSVKEEEHEGTMHHVKTIYVIDETAGEPADWSLLNALGMEGFTDITYIPCASVEEANELAKAGEKNSLLCLLVKEEPDADTQEETDTEQGTVVEPEEIAPSFFLHILLPEETLLEEDDAFQTSLFFDSALSLILMQKAGLSPAQAAQLMTPPVVETILAEDVIDKSEETLSETEILTEQVRSVLLFLLPYLNIMVLYFMVLFYGQGASNQIILEKTSKLMDTFLVTVSPTALMFGKVLAVIAVSTLQFMAVLCSLLGGFAAGYFMVHQINPASQMTLVRFIDSLGEISRLEGLFTPAGFVLFCLMILAGFALYCSLAAIGGALAGKPEDLSSTNVLFTLILVVSFMATLFAGGLTGGEYFSAWLDFVPFTSVLITPSRILLGEVSIPMGCLSLLLVILVCVVSMWVAGKLYRMMALYKGNLPKPKQVFAMLKEKSM